MRGLLIKDLKVLLQQKKTWMSMILLSVVILFSTSDLSFISGYVNIMACMMALSTISYDEMDNGYTFLFTLPIDVKGYVLMKYVLCISVSVVVSGVTNLLFFVASEGAYSVEDVLSAVLVLVFVMMMQFIMIPLQLKFGAEKSRIAYLLIAGATIVLVLLFEQFSGYLPEMSGMAIWIENLQFVEIVGLVGLFAVVMALISFACSCRVMNRKQL